MPLHEDELIVHLGNCLSDLEGRVTAATMEKLKALDCRTAVEFDLPAIDYFFLAHHLGNQSHKDLAVVAGISASTLARLFRFYSLPSVERKEAIRRNWNKSGFREKHARITSATLSRLNADPEFSRKNAATASARLHARWKNPEYAQKMADAARNYRSGNPDFEERLTQAKRDARYRPEGLQSRVHIPSIHGYRSDIGFYAQSMMEANVARVLMYNHANMARRQTFRLSIPAEYRRTIGICSDETEITIDFAVRDTRGKLTLYEIITQPVGEAAKRAKLDLLKQQHPQFALVIVDSKYYEGLRKEYAPKINKSDRFCGWETRQDNLRNNPAKYS